MSTLLTTDEVAELLRMSDWSVRDLVRQGKLPVVRLRPRGKLLFSRESVERVLRESETAVPSCPGAR